MNLEEFLVKSNQAGSVADLQNAWMDFLTGLGIDRYIMGEISIDSRSEKKDQLDSCLVDYPEKWFKQYIDHHDIDLRPIYQQVLGSRTPFMLKEHQLGIKSSRALKMLNDSTKNKACSGIGLTVYQPLGKIVGFGFSGLENRVRCDKDALSRLHAAAHQYVQIYFDLIPFERPIASSIRITKREREVLTWVSRGKTKLEVAIKLRVSESCVKRHCENMFKKFGTNNLTATVAKALRMGLMSPY